MRNALLTVTLFSGVALGASGLAAQEQFPLSPSPDRYFAPFVGVELTGLVQEGRSAFSPSDNTFSASDNEGVVTFDNLALPQENDTLPAEQ